MDGKVKLTDPGHRYFHDDGYELLSMSAFLNFFKKPFDREMISNLSARKELRLAGIAQTEENINTKQEELKKKWDKTRDDAATHGTTIHENIESYFKTSRCLDDKFLPLCKSLFNRFGDYKKMYSELIIYSNHWRIAGTCDKVMVRRKGGVYDIKDYKTNLSKGIETYSKYGNYMKEPIAHLEDCNYHHYAMQLTGYAYFLETEFDMKIGNLEIIYIPPTEMLSYKVIPVPYMKADFASMLISKRKEVMEIINERTERSNMDISQFK